MYVHRVNHTVILLVLSRSSEVAVYFLSSVTMAFDPLKQLWLHKFVYREEFVIHSYIHIRVLRTVKPQLYRVYFSSHICNSPHHQVVDRGSKGLPTIEVTCDTSGLEPDK